MEDRNAVPQRPQKSPGFAGFLGIFPFGAGAFYNGQRAKAFLYLVIFAGLINAMESTTKIVSVYPDENPLEYADNEVGTWKLNGISSRMRLRKIT